MNGGKKKTTVGLVFCVIVLYVCFRTGSIGTEIITFFVIAGIGKSARSKYDAGEGVCFLFPDSCWSDTLGDTKGGTCIFSQLLQIFCRDLENLGFS